MFPGGPVALALIVACQPAGTEVSPRACPATPLSPGEVVVGPIVCNPQVPLGGDATASDTWLANSRFRVVVRAPTQALTLRGIGGATLIDAAPWGQRDALNEVVPLIGGGWLHVTAFEVLDDGVRVAGTVRALLPDVPADVGAPGEVRYRIQADDPWLHADGAEGFYVHVKGDAETWGDGAVVVGGTLIAGEPGAGVTDLGGALIVTGTDRLLIDATAPGWTAWAGDQGVDVTGSAPGADALVWFTAGEVRGRSPVIGGVLDQRIPADADSVRVEARGRAPSATVVPGTDLQLVLGAAASLRLEPAQVDAPLDIAVDWVADDGRTGRFLLGPEPSSLPLGAGRHQLTLHAGPAFLPQSWRIELADDEIRTLGLRLAPAFDRGDWVLAGFDRRSDRDRGVRISDPTAAEDAVAEGLGYAVFAPLDVPAGILRTDTLPDPGVRLDERPLPPRLALRSGSRLQGDGWALSAWPWDSDPGNALYGGVLAEGLSPQDAAAAAVVGRGSGRALRVDVGWLDLVGIPFAVDPQPDFVALEGPGPDLEAWAPWFAWLDAARAVVPTGPATWVPVPDPGRFGAVDVEQALYRGHVAAGTGPIVELEVDGHPPGDVVPEADVHDVRVQVHGVGGDFGIRLVGSGGRVLASGPAPGDTLTRLLQKKQTTWLIAVAVREDDPESWAVTGPVWLAPVIRPR